jgi:predicted RNase H-like nuclease (RuvC/YqgF family)
MVLREEIQTILSLQAIENEIAKVEGVIQRYEEARPVCQARLARAVQKVEECKNAIRDLERQLRETERQVTEWRENLRKFTAQQFKVKNQKEYDALTVQIEELQQKISDADENGLADLEQEEVLTRKRTQLEEHLAAEETECRAEFQRIDLGRGENLALVEKLREERPVGATGGSRLFAALRTHSGTFPGRLCGRVARWQLQWVSHAVVLHTIQASSQSGLVVCNSCHRFLYIPEV